MTPLKLFMDARPGRLPDGSYPYGKNGIQYDLQGSILNEPGFRKMAAVVPYTLIGVIETDSKPVVFSTDQTNSAIGFFNPDSGLYEPIVDDRPAGLINWPVGGQRLGFSLDWYITGESQRNYKGELVVAFTDKNKFPKYLNCDSPDITRLDDIRLFPYFTPPRVELTQTVGGSLAVGTYYAAVGYERNDGTATPYSEVSPGVTITPGDIADRTDKAILVQITAADRSYDFVRLAIISRVAGRTQAVELVNRYPITSGRIDILYTGDNLTEPITVQEILTPPAVYEKVGTMGQLNDALYIGDLETETDLIKKLQMHVSKASVKWRSQLMDATAPSLDHREGKLRGLMHEETYALYIRFHKTRGGYTKAFHLPAPPLQAAFVGNSTEAVTGGEVLPIPKHKVEDCIPAFDAVARTGTPGTFLNELEVYPNDPEFDGTPIGGENLIGKNVRHHRMPSLRWCKINLYSSEPAYGRTKLDLLTLEVVGLTIPPEYVDMINGYELLFAKRTPPNMTIYGQSTLLHGAAQTTQAAVPTGSTDIFTTGGNWMATIVHAGSGDYDDNLELTSLRLDTMRFHAFDILLNKPSIDPTFISSQFKIRRDKLQSEGYYEDGAQDGAHNMPTAHLIDYTLGINPQSIPAGRTLRKLKNSFYAPLNVTVQRFVNMRHETCFAGTLGGANWPLAYGEMGYRIKGNDNTEVAQITDFEETYVVNLLAYKPNVYAEFYAQSLVSAGPYKALTDLTPFTNWDTFVCDYTFHTYGRHDAIDTMGEGFKGIKVIRRFVCEAISNIHLRYEIPGNEYSKWYPHTSITGNDPPNCYIVLFDRSKDPNQFGYSKDLNALNDFISSTIFNPFDEEITKFPYRVHRGGKLSRQTKARSWRTFLPLDYYECQKDRGRIINLAGMYDRLIIHHESAMFITQGKGKLEAGLLSVTLGTGDIFQFEPQEGVPSKLGYAGTQHDLACVKTPVGYVFVDARTGEMFIWSGKQPDNMNKDVNTFFRDALKVAGKNVYTGNGITIGWDTKYKRIIITVKNEQAGPATTVKIFADTNAFFNSLVVGDIVNYFGRLIEYKGLNVPATSGFDCPADPPPPDKFAWEPNTVVCEKDIPLSTIPFPVPGGYTGLSSPAELFYNTPSNQVYVGDHDQILGNFYRVHLTDGTKTYFGAPGVEMYSIVKDREYNKIYGTSATGGLHVFDIATGTVTLIPFGSATPYSRVGLWIVGAYVIARDLNTNSFTLFDRSNQNLVAVRSIAFEVPMSAVYLNEDFQLLDVNGRCWVIPRRRANPTIAVYNNDLSVLITTLTVPGALTVGDYGGDHYHMVGYHDIPNGKVYIYDTGSLQTFVVDVLAVTVSSTLQWYATDLVPYVRARFVKDPINGNIYMCYLGVGADGLTPIENRIYTVDAVTSQFVRFYKNKTIEGDLERIGLTENMWTAFTGNRKWEAGPWDTDGYIKQYAHAE